MNRLAQETSPYLLQHKDNPVDWYPCGEEALERARSEQRPLLVSIGYSACHWCHVMERESFEDAAVAAILNEHFVSIKVDREERPDVDSIYMQAVQMMTGHGGWPMSMFLTPDGRPFYAGTYFPPESRYGMPSFRQVILQLADAYRSRRGDVESAGNEIRAALSAVPDAQRASVDRGTLDQAASKILQGYDPVNGGFGGAPKFPPSLTLDFLMQAGSRSDVVTHTLRKMAEGGMYDQVGGGFHRYSTDAEWLVPHFEKMLYDNALLARLYTRAWQWTHDPFFARIANEILAFVAREMTSPDGAFYSTLDADSEGEEGKFYVWSRAEVMSILGEEDGKVVCELFDVTERGNWEGKNIPHVVGDVDAHRELVLRAKCKLYGARAERVRPARDEKVLSSWNGWMLAAFAEACIAFGRYEDVVRKNADFLLTRIDTNGRLIRHAKINGLLEDYAGVAWALTLAYEAVNEPRYLDAARVLADQILSRFADETNGGFFDTPVDHEQLITRPKDLFDNATPGGNSVAAMVLLRLGGNYAEAARKTVESILPVAERYPSGFGFLLGVAEWLAGSPKEIHLAGDDVAAFRKVIGETYLPHRTIEYAEGEKASAFVCENFVCLAPTDDPERFREQLAKRSA
ncbi:MAG TPA: thioredoxin domain-containing protein [Thermoanaerobaculia bacterium]|nr:thioredoxin domain-containing protein [Thermoanaerobaculia bacterium]